MKKKKIILFCLLFLFVIDMFLVILGYTSFIDDFVHKIVTIWENDFITNLMKSFTFLGSTPFMISLAGLILLLFYFKKDVKKGLLSAILLINSTIVNNVVKVFIRRERPSYITVVENTFSFPSGHMMASTTVYGFIIYFICNSNISKKYKPFLIILMILLMIFVGISRMYLGAHYFTDIFGAYLLSSSLILIYDIYLEPKFKIISH